jgi:hypothetical protein
MYGQSQLAGQRTQQSELASSKTSPDNVRYASSCPGADIGAKINACAALLPADAKGHKTGTIILPNTNADASYAKWSTEARIGPGVSLIGQGVYVSHFDCTAQICLLGDASDPDGEYGFTVSTSDYWTGFSITGAGNKIAGQEIIALYDRVNLTVMNVWADGSYSRTGSCIHLRTKNYWTERNTFISVATYYGCKIGWRFTADATNPNPLPSFGYNRFLDIRANPNDVVDPTGETAVSIEDNSYFYNSTVRLTVNVDTHGGPRNSIVVHLQDTAKFLANELHLSGEGPAKYLIDLSSSHNAFVYYGQINFANATNRFTAGSVVTHYLDDGGNGPAVPITSWNGIESLQPVELPSGTNLDTVSSCGYFTGTNLQNAPSAVGSHHLRIETICGGNPNTYRTQIAYQMENTDGKPRVWQRVEDAGKWGAWREQAWTDQQWDSPPKVNHTVCVKIAGPPVTLGYCSTQPDGSGACRCN